MTGWILALAGIGALAALARRLGRAGERQAETGDREVLLALQRGQAHGHDIVRRAMERTDGRVILGPSMLYGSLKRLLDRGLVEEVDLRPDPELDAEERRHFRLTPAGEIEALRILYRGEPPRTPRTGQTRP